MKLPTDPLDQIALFNQDLDRLFTSDAFTGRAAAKMATELYVKFKKIFEENLIWGRVDVDRQLRLIRERLILLFQTEYKAGE